MAFTIDLSLEYYKILSLKLLWKFVRRKQHTDWCISWTEDLRQSQKNLRHKTVTQTARYKKFRDQEKICSFNTTVLASIEFSIELFNP